MNVYLGKAETAFVQGKPKGYVRDLVRREMAEEENPDVRDVHAWEPDDVPEDYRDVRVWKPPEVRPPGLKKR